MTAELEALPGVSAAVHALFPALEPIPQLVAQISTLLDYSTLWTLEDASATGCLRLVKRVAAHEELRSTVVVPPPSELARRASFTAATAEAAEEGHLPVFTWLVTSYSPGDWDVTDAMERASRHGHLSILQWANDHPDIATFRWTTKMMIVAAIGDHFEIVRWLHEHSSAPGSPHVMDCAAEALDLEMVEWLHNNRTEGCTTYAMDNAARKGSLEIVKWLHKNRHEGCTVSALHCAAVNGHAHVVRWLDEHVAVGDRRRAFASAVRWGHIEVVMALAKYCTVDTDTEALKELMIARRRAETEMRSTEPSSLMRARRQRLLYSQRILDGPAEENAVWYGRLEVLQFLFSNGMVSKNGRSRAELAATAKARGHVNVAQWLMNFTTDEASQGSLQ